MSHEPLHINAASFDRAVLQSPVPVLVDFWAPWCGPCRMIAPLLDEIARDGEGRFRVAKVNVDDEPALMQRFNVRGIPALLFFSGGELRHQVAGLTAKKVIVEKLEALARQSRRCLHCVVSPLVGTPPLANAEKNRGERI